ncbi:MAG: hypothetical protein ACJ8OJ_08275 [Povalibacter sp.]
MQPLEGVANNSHKRRLCNVVVIISGVMLCAIATADEVEDIVVACERSTITLEPASPAIAQSVLQAVGQACATPDQSAEWLCDGRPLTFLQEVGEDGVRRLEGNVCLTEQVNQSSDESEEPEESACVGFEYVEASAEFRLIPSDE